MFPRPVAHTAVGTTTSTFSWPGGAGGSALILIGPGPTTSPFGFRASAELLHRWEVRGDVPPAPWRTPLWELLHQLFRCRGVGGMFPPPRAV